MRHSRLKAISLTDAERLQIGEEYKSGMRSKDLAKRWGVSQTFVAGIVRTLGARRPLGHGNARLSPERQAAMIADYQSGMNCSECATKYGFKQDASVWEFLKRRGLTRNPSEARRLYAINYHAFDVITDESAYWLGFLITDGCLHQRPSNTGGDVLILTMADCDRPHLEAYRQFLGAEHPIKRNPPKRPNAQGTNILPITITAEMSATLRGYGIVPRKSFVMRATDILASNRHFWRGVMDGNGSLGFYSAKRGLTPRALLRLSTASLQFAEQFLAFCRDAAGVTIPKVHYDPRGCYGVSYQALKARTVATHLYRDCTVALSRKLALAQRMMEKTIPTAR